MTMYQSDPEAVGGRKIDVCRLLRILWKKAWLVVIVSVVLSLLLYGYSVLFVPSTYRTGFTAYINNRMSTEGMSSTTTSDLTASMGVAFVYKEIITSRSVIGEAAEECGMGNQSVGVLQRAVDVSISNETPVVTVYVTMEDPAMATKFATAISQVAPAQVSRVIEGSSMSIIDPPAEPSRKYAPNNQRYAVLGFTIGLLLSCGGILLFALLSDKVQSAAELEERYGVTVIGRIPAMEARRKGVNYYYKYARKGGY